MADERNSLGPKLRQVRAHRGLSLREIASDSGFASGYLSQLERGDVGQPTPSTLKRLADVYGVPLPTLMGWSGYDVPDTPTSPHLAWALSVIGDDPSEGEVKAIEAVLEVLRKGRAGFSGSHYLDHPLSAADRQVIRECSLALLREAGVYGEFPTRLEDLMDVAKLVYAGEISLTAEERRGLWKRLGDRLKWALEQVQGLITFGSGEIWLAPDLHPMRQRFVHAHEIGHYILPAHKELAYLENWETMDPRVRDMCEREANQAAIELLAQGDRLRAMADDSKFDRISVSALARVADISLQATTRRLAEDSKRLCATVVYYKGGGRLMDPHVYTSESFETRFLWKTLGMPEAALKETIRTAAVTQESRELICGDVKERQVVLRCEGIDTRKALIGLIAKDPGGPVAKIFPVRGSIKVRGAA
jgi:transcriptional regulator with XRE-family HTH domain